jgi:N6-L-threonylcarbamoyladenine synthase
MKLLILETTCDETSAAVVTDELKVLGAVVASQDELHKRYHGVVPELAARAHVERVLPVVDEALNQARLTLRDIDAVAVANTPGLAGALLVGLVAAKTIAMTLDVPLVPVNHLQGHIYACQMSAGVDVFPCVGLVVSGGHSSLYRCHTPTEFKSLGGTIDDAAGEAFDKVAAMLGLPYPGGPAIAALAEAGDAKSIRFPRPLLRDKQRLDFSFSGLKTAVRYEIAGSGGDDPSQISLADSRRANIAASFQEAVVDCLVDKSIRALQQTCSDRLCVGGGVAANRRLRTRLAEAAESHAFELIIAPLHLCTDNAVMGAIAIEHLAAGETAGLDLDISPGLQRP